MSPSDSQSFNRFSPLLVVYRQLSIHGHINDNSLFGNEQRNPQSSATHGTSSGRSGLNANRRQQKLARRNGTVVNTRATTTSASSFTYREALERAARSGTLDEMIQGLTRFLRHEQDSMKRYHALQSALEIHCRKPFCDALVFWVRSFVENVSKDKFKLFGLEEAMLLRARADDAKAIEYMLPVFVQYVPQTLQRDFALQNLLDISFKRNNLSLVNVVLAFFDKHVKDSKIKDSAQLNAEIFHSRMSHEQKVSVIFRSFSSI